jgi:hypothetical protein
VEVNPKMRSWCYSAIGENASTSQSFIRTI